MFAHLISQSNAEELHFVHHRTSCQMWTEELHFVHHSTSCQRWTPSIKTFDKILHYLYIPIFIIVNKLGRSIINDHMEIDGNLLRLSGVYKWKVKGKMTWVYKNTTLRP